MSLMSVGFLLALVSVADAPFSMPPIEEPTIPAREFRIDAYGARTDGSNVCAAIASYVEACAAAAADATSASLPDWHVPGQDRRRK